MSKETDRPADDEIAALKKEVAALKSTIGSTSVDARAAAQWQDEMRDLAERRARHAMPPSAVREMAVIPDDIVRGIVRDNRAPTGPSSAGAIPSSQQISNVRGAGGGSGWAREIPLSNPPGTHLVDALCIADDIKSRSEGKHE